MTHEWVEYRTQGYSQTADTLEFAPGRTRCGDIEDGIGLAHKGEGGWAIRFADLEDMYIRALLARDGRPYRADIEVRIAAGVDD